MLTLCLLSPKDMRKHVTMTLLDTEQSYVESLRTLMQVRLEAINQAPESGRSESRRLSHTWEKSHFYGQDGGWRRERNDPGIHHPSVEKPPSPIV